MLTIIDYGTGNLNSIKNMLKRLGVDSVISNQKEAIFEADKLILPGIGSFDYGMEQLHLSGLVEAMNEKVLINKTPLLGICLGVQLLTEGSEEGKDKGLGWVKAKTVSFDRSKLADNLKIPHMGWSDVVDTKQSKLFIDMHEEPRFYFVHSYHLQVEDENDVFL